MQKSGSCPLHSSSSEHWKLYARHLASLFRASNEQSRRIAELEAENEQLLVELTTKSDNDQKRENDIHKLCELVYAKLDAEDTTTELRRNALKSNLSLRDHIGTQKHLPENLREQLANNVHDPSTRHIFQSMMYYVGHDHLLFVPPGQLHGQGQKPKPGEVFPVTPEMLKANLNGIHALYAQASREVYMKTENNEFCDVDALKMWYEAVRGSYKAHLISTHGLLEFLRTLGHTKYGDKIYLLQNYIDLLISEFGTIPSNLKRAADFAHRVAVGQPVETANMTKALDELDTCMTIEEWSNLHFSGYYVDDSTRKYDVQH